MPPFEGIPAALKVIRAIDEVQKLPALGDCPTKRAAEDKRMRWYAPGPSDNEDENDSKPSAKELGRIQRNEVCDFPSPFTLRALSTTVAHRL